MITNERQYKISKAELASSRPETRYFAVSEPETTVSDHDVKRLLRQRADRERRNSSTWRVSNAPVRVRFTIESKLMRVAAGSRPSFSPACVWRA